MGMSDLYKSLVNTCLHLYIPIAMSKWKRIQIEKHDQTYRKLLEGKSLVRFGDGEMRWIKGKQATSFQDNNEILAKRLGEILASNNPNILIGIPDICVEEGRMIERKLLNWKLHFSRYIYVWLSFLNKNQTYADSLITRPYVMMNDKSECESEFNAWKEIWHGKDVVLIEGRETRFGVGNDLLNNASHIERILCPATNAFACYDKIFEEAMKCDDNKLLLVALGPTATVLAYDLACNGKQAIDIGHLDIEYEWYIRGAQGKCGIAGKYVNEATNLNPNEGEHALEAFSEYVREKYLAEIVAEIVG